MDAALNGGAIRLVITILSEVGPQHPSMRYPFTLSRLRIFPKQKPPSGSVAGPARASFPGSAGVKCETMRRRLVRFGEVLRMDSDLPDETKLPEPPCIRRETGKIPTTHRQELTNFRFTHDTSGMDLRRSRCHTEDFGMISYGPGDTTTRRRCISAYKWTG